MRGAENAPIGQLLASLVVQSWLSASGWEERRSRLQSDEVAILFVYSYCEQSRAESSHWRTRFAKVNVLPAREEETEAESAN